MSSHSQSVAVMSAAVGGAVGGSVYVPDRCDPDNYTRYYKCELKAYNTVCRRISHSEAVNGGKSNNEPVIPIQTYFPESMDPYLLNKYIAMMFKPVIRT